MTAFSAQRICPVCNAQPGEAGLMVVFCDPTSTVQNVHPMCDGSTEPRRTPQAPHVHRICATCGWHHVETLSAQQIAQMVQYWP